MFSGCYLLANATTVNIINKHIQCNSFQLQHVATDSSHKLQYVYIYIYIYYIILNNLYFVLEQMHLHVFRI